MLKYRSGYLGASSGTMMYQRSTWLACVVLAVCLSCLPADDTVLGWDIELTVQNHTGVACESSPVTSGVPLKMGMLTSVDGLRMADATGKTLPAQFRALTRWPDGSIRWVLCDFQVSLAARQKAVFRLANQSASPVTAGELSVHETARAVDINTGAARFTISKERFNLLDRVVLTGEAKPEVTVVAPDNESGVLLTTEAGTRYRSSAEKPQVTIEERGPMRVCVKIASTLNTKTGNPLSSGPLSHTTRIHAYRNHSFVKVQFVLEYDDRRFEKEYAEWEVTRGRLGGLRSHDFRSFALLLRTSITPTGFALGGDQTHEGRFAGRWVELYQDSSGTDDWGPAPGWPTTFRGYQVFRGPSKKLAEGRHAIGWGDLHDGTVGVMVGMRRYWQNFPKATVLGAGGRLAIELFPRRWKETHHFYGGLNKTHDVIFYFHRGDSQAARCEAVAKAFEEPLRATVANTWYRDTLALGYISTNDRCFQEYDHSAKSIARGVFEVRRQRDLFGWMHFGDDYRNSSKQQSKKLWAHNEFDLAYSMLLGYLRDPEHDLRFLQNGETMTRHVMDVVTYHTTKDKPWYNYSQHQHGGFDTASGFDHHGTPGHSHFWIQNMVLYYYLTGDEHVRDIVQRVADNCQVVWTGPSPGSWDGREWEARDKGWSLCALVEAYECTGDAEWLDVVREKMIPYLAQKQHPRGCILEENEEDNLAKPWQLGYLSEGLGRYAVNQRLRGAPDKQAEDILHKLNHFLKHDAEGGKVYEWYTHGRHVRDWNFSTPLANGFAYEYLITGEAKYREWAVEAAQPLFQRRLHYQAGDRIAQKSSALGLRFGQVAMYLMQNEDGREE